MQRSDSIDLAKAIAVVSVFLYHLPGSPLKSGFLGVDLFLIVTGFLSAHTLQNKGWHEFIINRIDRVWLPLITTVVLIFSAFYGFLFSFEAYNFVIDALFALWFLSNIALILFSGGYFAAETQFSPFFHLWSISLEVQLWVMFAIIALLFRGRMTLIIVCLTVLSFIYSAVVVMGADNINNFYLTPYGRFWEAGLGYLLYASRLELRLPKLFFETIVITMFVVLLVDIKQNFIIWSFFVLGSAILIVHQSQLTLRVRKIMRYLSTRTYGIYLSHVPIIVYLDIYRQLDTLYVVVLSVGLSLAFSELSFRYLERS